MCVCHWKRFLTNQIKPTCAASRGGGARSSLGSPLGAALIRGLPTFILLLICCMYPGVLRSAAPPLELRRGGAPLCLLLLLLGGLELSLARAGRLLVGLVDAVDEGPALDPLALAGVHCLRVLEDLLLLRLCAVEVLVVLLEVTVCRLGGRHAQAAALHHLPVDVAEKRMHLDFRRAARPGAQALAGVSIQQVDDQVLGLVAHADGQLKHASLNIIE